MVCCDIWSLQHIVVVMFCLISGTRKAAGNKPKVKEPVFDDDDDDIFASIPSSKAKKPAGQSQLKKELVTDEVCER